MTVAAAKWSYSGLNTLVRAGTAPGRREVACLWRSGRTALARRTARRSTALSRWRYKIAPGCEAAAPGRPLWRPAHGGGGESRVGDVVVFGAHCPGPDDDLRRHGAGPVEGRALPRLRCWARVSAATSFVRSWWCNARPARRTHHEHRCSFLGDRTKGSKRRLNIHVDGGHDVVRNGRENIGERFGSARTTALASPFRLLKTAPKEASAARTSLSPVGMV